MYVFCTAFCYYFSRSELLCGSWERFNENMFNNHWGIGVAGILWLKQQLTHQCREASIMVWCSLPWGVWLGCEPALVCFCHSAPVLCLSLSLFSLSSRSLLQTHTDSFSYSLFHAFASFLSQAGSTLQTKWNLVHLKSLLLSQRIPVYSVEAEPWLLSEPHPTKLASCGK